MPTPLSLDAALAAHRSEPPAHYARCCTPTPASLAGTYTGETRHGWPVQLHVADLDSPLLIGWRDCDLCGAYRQASYGETVRYAASMYGPPVWSGEGRRERNVCRACCESELASIDWTERNYGKGA